jgi:hypothetical protein
MTIEEFKELKNFESRMLNLEVSFHHLAWSNFPRLLLIHYSQTPASGT